MKYPMFVLLFVMTLLCYTASSQSATTKSKETDTVKPIQKHRLPTKIGTLKFDLSFTKFSLAGETSNAMGKKYVYSLHGKKDSQSDKEVSIFFILAIDSMNIEMGKIFLDYMSEGYQETYPKVKLQDIQKTEIEVNGLNIYFIKFKAVHSSQLQKFITMAIASNGKRAVEFYGHDIDNNMYAEKFANTVKSIEIP